MVSEDSDQLGSGLLTVHGFDHFDEIGQAASREVSSTFHLLNAVSELLEVRLLCGSQRVLPEKWDYHRTQFGSPTHHESKKRLVVVVVSGVGIDATNPEERLQCLEAPNALGSLSNYELVRQLVPGSVAGSVLPMRLSHQAD